MDMIHIENGNIHLHGLPIKRITPPPVVPDADPDPGFTPDPVNMGE
jgi:hypothetical protein